MAFFNTKHVALRSSSSKTELESGVLVSIPFYFAEVFQDTEIISVNFQALAKSGRSTTVLTPLVPAYLVDGLFVCDYTPGVAGTDIIFRFVVTDCDGSEFIINSQTFEVVSTVV